MGRLRKFIASERAFKLMLIEAVVCLAWARVMKAIPFAKTAPRLGVAMKETSFLEAADKTELIQTVARAVRIMSRYTLWESKCLVMAIACMKMLEKRGIESTLYLGTMKNDKGTMSAHAWLRTGPHYVTGAEIMDRYTVVGIFGKVLDDSREGKGRVKMSRPNMLDISSFSKELRFLLQLLRSDRKLEAEEAMEQSVGMDWQSFLRFSVYHESFPVLYPLLLQLNANQQWTPEFVMSQLKALYTRNTLSMLHLRGEMERINSLFAAQEIRSLVLKGPVLAAMLYEDVSGRTSGDLDILVAKQDWDASVKQLVEAGYTRGEQYDESAEVLGNTERKTHHVSFIHPQKNIEVELHWSLNPDSVKEPTFEELWTRRQASQLNKSVFTLGNEDLLVYLILHGTRHGWTSLRWLMDIDRMLGRFLNWNRVNQLFTESGSSSLGGKAFALSTTLLGTLLPEEAHALTQHPKAYRLAQMTLPFIREEVVLYPKPERKDIAIAFNRYLLETMSFRHKLLYITNKLYPSSKDMRLLPLPRSLHFLYFPLRPFLWFWRQVKRQTT